MKNQTKHTARNQSGFTLVELVVVIAILGVMAAIAVPMVNTFLGSSKEQAYGGDLALIQAKKLLTMGTAMAAITPNIAMTTTSSTRVNPLWSLAVCLIRFFISEFVRKACSVSL